jgi:hypothetical protein
MAAAFDVFVVLVVALVVHAIWRMGWANVALAKRVTELEERVEAAEDQIDDLQAVFDPANRDLVVPEILPLDPLVVPANGMGFVSLFPRKGMLIRDLNFPSAIPGNAVCELRSFKVAGEEQLACGVPLSALSELCAPYSIPHVPVQSGQELYFQFLNHSDASVAIGGMVMGTPLGPG